MPRFVIPHMRRQHPAHHNVDPAKRCNCRRKNTETDEQRFPGGAVFHLNINRFMEIVHPNALN